MSSTSKNQNMNVYFIPEKFRKSQNKEKYSFDAQYNEPVHSIAEKKAFK
jgi:hypothetical protein